MVAATRSTSCSSGRLSPLGAPRAVGFHVLTESREFLLRDLPVLVGIDLFQQLLGTVLGVRAYADVRKAAANSRDCHRVIRSLGSFRARLTSLNVPAGVSFTPRNVLQQSEPSRGAIVLNTLALARGLSQPHLDGRALAELALNLDGPTVQVDDALGQGEPQAGAASSA